MGCKGGVCQPGPGGASTDATLPSAAAAASPKRTNNARGGRCVASVDACLLCGAFLVEEHVAFHLLSGSVPKSDSRDLLALRLSPVAVIVKPPCAVVGRMPGHGEVVSSVHVFSEMHDDGAKIVELTLEVQSLCGFY